MDIPLHTVAQWVEKEFPKPRVDPEWLQDCYTWLITEHAQTLGTDSEKLLKAVADQLFRSDLSSSMLPGTGLPLNVADPAFSSVLQGSVFVEIVALTEIAHSPFDLNRIRLEREERLKKLQNGIVDDDEEGPIPKYPRGMLKFHLSDGNKTLPAIEYRSLPQLSLEDTKLGFKLWLKDVRVNRGIAFLEPKTVALVGYETEQRDVNRDADFERYLHHQMGLPLPSSSENAAPPLGPQSQTAQGAQTPSSTQPAQNLRSPLREISPPPLGPTQPRNDDEKLESRRRRIPKRNMDIDPSASHTNTRIELTPDKPTTSSYFTDLTMPEASSSRTIIGEDPSMLSFSPTLRQTQRVLSFPSSSYSNELFLSDTGDLSQTLTSRARRIQDSQGPSHSLESQQVTGKGSKMGAGQMDVDEPRARARGTSPNSSDFGDIQFDVDTLAGLDAIEALNSTEHSVAVSSGRTVAANVITIDDSDEDDKENLPAPMRHVKRRINGMTARGDAGRENSRGPANLTSTASDIIDIVDSD